MIIGVTGAYSSGKDTVAEIIIKSGFSHISLSDILRDELKKEEKKITRDDLINGGNKLREKYGPNILAKKALEKAKEIGAITGLLICNNPPELEYIYHLISIIVGPEVITGSTRMKAGTATKMVLNMITTTAMIKLNKTYGNLMVDLKASNQKLWDRGTRIIEHLTELNYDDALNLLQSANGDVKTALVMGNKTYDYKKSRQMLIGNKGSLRRTLE